MCGFFQRAGERASVGARPREVVPALETSSRSVIWRTGGSSRFRVLLPSRGFSRGLTRERRSRCAECSAMASREPQRRSGAGPVSRDAAAAPVRARTTTEQRSVSTAMWCRGISLVILILGFVVGVLYASAKMRFVEDVLPKISGTRLRGPANVSRALPRRSRAPSAPRASTRPAFSFPLRSIMLSLRHDAPTFVSPTHRPSETTSRS